MYPIAHAWLVERLVADPRPAHYLGCVWPDMLYGSPLTHAQSHRSGHLLVEALPPGGSGEAGVLRAFVAGVLTHGSEPRGFDWYSDERYGDAEPAAKGYAFQRGAAFAGEAAAACDVPEQDGPWKAHNLVEMAFERRLYLEDTRRGERIAEACGDEGLVGGVADWLAGAFDVPEERLADAMRRFPEVVELRPATHEALATVYALQTRFKHPGAEPDADKIAALIARAEAAVARDGDAFLAFCASAVGEMLVGMLGA